MMIVRKEVRWRGGGRGTSPEQKRGYAGLEKETKESEKEKRKKKKKKKKEKTKDNSLCPPRRGGFIESRSEAVTLVGRHR